MAGTDGMVQSISEKKLTQPSGPRAERGRNERLHVMGRPNLFVDKYDIKLFGTSTSSCFESGNG